MAGWPARISRAILGPKRADVFPAPNDTNFVRDFFFNLLFHQVPGMNLFTPKVSGLVTSGGSLTSHDECWAPNGAGTAPTVAKPGTGQYRLTYLATYEDEEEQDVAPGLVWARGFVQSATCRIIQGTVTGGVQVDIFTFDAAGAAADAAFYFEAG